MVLDICRGYSVVYQLAVEGGMELIMSGPSWTFRGKLGTYETGANGCETRALELTFINAFVRGIRLVDEDRDDVERWMNEWMAVVVDITGADIKRLKSCK